MDHTVIDNDCDVSWKSFLISRNLATDAVREQAAYFWEQYAAGTLDQDAFIRFQLTEFAGKSIREMQDLADAHFDEVVRQTIYADARRMIADLHQSGATTCMITATNGVLAEPVAKALDFQHRFATELEIVDGRFTGRIVGEYCGGAGKVSYMQTLCERYDTTLAACRYFGDSVVDIPVLEAVGYPVAVNPGPELRAHAEQRQWTIMAFE